MKQKQCIVIGAGVAGLTCAALLARKGYKVEVFEQSDTYGGKVGKQLVGNAYFDTGPSLCTDVEIIDSVYALCGKNPRNYWSYTKLTELSRYFWPHDSTSYTMPIGIQHIEQSLVRELHESPKNVKQYLNRLLAEYSKIAPYYIDSPLRLTAILRPSVFIASIKLVPYIFNTLHTYNSKYFVNSKTVQILNRYATYSGSNPYHAPAVMGFAGVPELSTGAYFPLHGMRSIVDGLYKLCLDLGVIFHFSSTVNKINYKGNKIHSVEVGSDIYNCDTIVYGGDVVRLYDLLGDKRTKQKLSKPERSTSAFVFYWEVKGNHKAFGLHNILFSADYTEEYLQLQQGKVPLDPTIYVNISSRYDTSHAKKSTENWFIMINVPAGTKDAAVVSARKSVKQKLEKTLGKSIVVLNESYLSPSILDSRTGAWQGAIYGQANNSIASLLFRPRNNNKMPNTIYRVGGTVHPGGGIPLAIRSAIITANKI